MSSNQPISITASNLSKTYSIFDTPGDRLKQMLSFGYKKFYKEHQALKDVSLTIHQGETVGIVGQNGSGKSTLLQLLCGIITPTSGYYKTHGRISALLELGAGFNPEFTGKENLILNGMILGMSKDEIAEKSSSIEAFAAIGDMINQPVKTYSSGMYVRLAFAIAIASDPDILIVDEALAVGDEAFQRKCFARIKQIQENGGTILFVSHAANTIVDLCNRAILIDQGELLCEGEPKSIIANYQKLIYAPPSEIQHIRKQLSASSQEGTPSKTAYQTTQSSESSVEYHAHGARITNPHITDQHNNPVNVLHRGEHYNYTYDITFDTTIAHPRFGMMIKTKNGVELAGHFTPPEDRTYHKGDRITLSYPFTCHFLPGSYFVNAGCYMATDESDVFPIHRILDACMFSVLPDGSTYLTGTLDLCSKAIVTTQAHHVTS